MVHHQFAHCRRAPFVGGLGTCRGVRNISAGERSIDENALAPGFLESNSRLRIRIDNKTFQTLQIYQESKLSVCDENKTKKPG